MGKSRSPVKDSAPQVEANPEMAARAREALKKRNSKK